ncbi:MULTISPECIES: FecR family protein [Methylosinus]|uniref:Iron dicitrate transport regulator FecR n=1 Tax=Methylosinus trichosporium (strain ATCC 35070 / NCIMB 11131 / UNIQEM 75 / OB3b) TaxID=595536 RepID=A0A2D2D708_METT3|nr:MULTISPECIES: FecR domain-containing protein [Methylosinus]ATQ70639.1 iron dicitrate transport regulator FecR [Methylosinus trichosporium OB3b]OBS50741.1 iron dicitrate transport regulator FecR [Methylosinus sp. 3S-1]
MERSSHQDDRLWDEALDLVIRLQNDPLNPVTLDMIRGWRRRSPVHAAAWSEACEIHGLSGQVLAARREAEPAARGLVSRRLLLAGGAAAAAVGGLAAPQLLLRAKADHITEAGETRRVMLADGSAATLGPASAIRLAFTADARDVELLAGMAFFEIAPDARRPFRVASEQLAATALGTAFEMSNDAGRLSVCVDHGLVRIDLAEAATRSARLAAGDWLTFDAGRSAIESGRRESVQIAAWRDGWMFANDETVSALVARISRWRPGRILLADPYFGGERVSGAFDLRDPRAALEAVVSPFGGVVRMLTPYLTVISRF